MCTNQLERIWPLKDHGVTTCPCNNPLVAGLLGDSGRSQKKGQNRMVDGKIFGEMKSILAMTANYPILRHQQAYK